MMIGVLIRSCLLALHIGPIFAWLPSHTQVAVRWPSTLTVRKNLGSASRTQLHLFDKIFEEEGILGKGITVGKVQVALTSPSRGPDSIFGMLEKEASDDKSLSELTNAICLALLRKSDQWIGAYGTSQWFGRNDAGKAESLFNDFSNKEATKFEKVRCQKLARRHGKVVPNASTLTLWFCSINHTTSTLGVHSKRH
jgi:Protein of unknown function (DUF1517)